VRSVVIVFSVPIVVQEQEFVCQDSHEVDLSLLIAERLPQKRVVEVLMQFDEIDAKRDRDHNRNKVHISQDFAVYQSLSLRERFGPIRMEPDAQAAAFDDANCP
jgi:hypothetical protein